MDSCRLLGTVPGGVILLAQRTHKCFDHHGNYVIFRTQMRVFHQNPSTFRMTYDYVDFWQYPYILLRVSLAKIYFSFRVSCGNGLPSETKWFTERNEI